MVFGALVGAVLGHTRNNTTGGALLGMVLGPLGWLITLLIDRRRECPECQGIIPITARKCQHCGSPIPQWVFIKCPACGERGKVSEETAHGEIECPDCKRHFQIPAR